MGRDLDLDDVVAQYPEAKRELEQLRDDLTAARAALDGIPRMILSPAYYGETAWGKAILAALAGEKHDGL